MKKFYLWLLVPAVLVTFSSFAQAGEHKKTVTVARFKNKSGWAGSWDIENGVADQLTVALIQSGQFVVVSRRKGKQGYKSNRAQAGPLDTAQILIRGTITEFRNSSSGSGGAGIFGFGGGGKEAKVRLRLRLVDTATGQALDYIKAEGSASGAEDAARKALYKAVKKIIKDTSKIPFEAKVVSVSGPEIIISAGRENGVYIGDTFGVYREGNEVVDPDTGVQLGHDETRIGMIEVYEVHNSYSKANDMDGQGFAKGQVVRGAP
ncbi:MAG: hypothetical protein M0018_03780 [Nitrospiraceae bacterium]|nr:hypothetical protein [Nitrospiraceae bacterium]